MRPWLAALSLTLVLLGFLVALLMPRHCPVSRGAFARIERGMTRAEVHAILGGPPGDYRTRPHPPPPCVVAITSVWVPAGDVEVWEGDEGGVVVEFYAERPGLTPEVVSLKFVEAGPHDQGPLSTVRWRLGRTWAKVFP